MESLLSNQDNDTNQKPDEKHESFRSFFLLSSGPPQLVGLSMMYAVAMGSVVGVVPSVMTDQYAKINHGLDYEMSCADFSMEDKPQACLDGSSDAQTSAAIDSLVSNILAFLTSSVVGSISDEIGRRKILIFAQFLVLFPSLCIVLLQKSSTMNPFWYYLTDSALGIVSWISIALSALSDVMPKQWRAASFGLILSGFFLGFAFAPFFAVWLTHFGVSVLSFILLGLSFVFSALFLPETLSAESAEQARQVRFQQNSNNNSNTQLTSILQTAARPIKDLSILYRNQILRLLSCLAFFSGMSTSADQTLLLYYLQDWMSFNDKDVAVLFAILGIFGVLVQGVGLKFITDLVGERYVIVIAFIFGSLHNVIYSFASNKTEIFIGASLGSICDIAFPTISAVKSIHVENHEQGRIQGALYALTSLAKGVGPAALRLGYKATRDTKHPGSFFLIASFFFAIATICAFMLPEEVNSCTSTPEDDDIQLDRDVIGDNNIPSPNHSQYSDMLEKEDENDTERTWLRMEDASSHSSSDRDDTIRTVSSQSLAEFT